MLGTVTWMSITSLAAIPGTDVDPMWSTRSACSPAACRNRAVNRWACAGHVRSYGDSVGAPRGDHCRNRTFSSNGTNRPSHSSSTAASTEA